MTERPIIFSAPMVRALLEGRKTQTRRILKLQPEAADCIEAHPDHANEFSPWRGGERLHSIVVPFAKGDRLWVRENCRGEELDSGLDGVRYKADDVFVPIENTQRAGIDWLALHTYRGHRGSCVGPWVPSIHMPRWASRITLAVTEVRVQRLQDISRDDAMAEGIVQTWGDFMGDPPEWAVASINRHGDASGSHIYDNRTSVANFRELWSHINGPGSWDANPWVAAISFTVEKGP